MLSLRYSGPMTTVTNRGTTQTDWQIHGNMVTKWHDNACSNKLSRIHDSFFHINMNPSDDIVISIGCGL